MDISGCMCKFCEDIAFDTTIDDLGIRLENEIGSFRRFISCYTCRPEMQSSLSELDAAAAAATCVNA